MATNPLPDLDIEKVQRACRRRVPEQLKDEIRLEVTVRGKRVSIHEQRPVWRGAPGEWTSMPIAQFRYEGEELWTLYFGDSRGKWTRYFELEPRQPIDVIINQVDTDPTGIFWG